MLFSVSKGFYLATGIIPFPHAIFYMLLFITLASQERLAQRYLPVSNNTYDKTVTKEFVDV